MDRYSTVGPALAQEQSPRTMGAIDDRMSALVKRAVELVGEADSARDAIVGGHPTPDRGAPAATAPKPVPNGFLERISDHLDALSYLLNRISTAVGDINQRQ